MFELPQQPPTIWERGARTVFGFFGRGLRVAEGALRTVGSAFWRHPVRSPLLLTAGGALAILGVWKTIHEPFNWRYSDSEGPGVLLMTLGALMMYLGFRKRQLPKN